MLRSRAPFVVERSVAQCEAREPFMDSERMLAIAILVSLTAFTAGYLSRGLSLANSNLGWKTGSIISQLQQLYGTAVRASSEQYRALAEVCEALNDGSLLDNSDDSDSDSASESDVETPKAIREEATDYFPPTMSRRRMPDTPIPPSVWDECLSYDRTLMNWTTAFVEDSIGPAALRMVKETTPKTIPGETPLNGTKLLVDMYEAFKGEVEQIIAA